MTQHYLWNSILLHILIRLSFWHMKFPYMNQVACEFLILFHWDIFFTLDPISLTLYYNCVMSFVIWDGKFWASLVSLRDFPVVQMVKSLPAMRETWVWSLSREDPLEKEMATHSSILARKIPWMEEFGRLQSMGSQRVRHDWATVQQRCLQSCPPTRSFRKECLSFAFLTSCLQIQQCSILKSLS